MTNKRKFQIAVLASVLSIWFHFSTVHAYSNYISSPFPLCPMDGKTSGFKGQIDAFYSFVDAGSTNLDCSGLTALGVKENPEAGKPSYHFTFHGAIVQGEQAKEFALNNNQVNKDDVDGYSLGASITPSFVLSDRYHGCRPSVFLGSNVQYQKLEIGDYEDLNQYNPADWTHPVYNPFLISYPVNKEMAQIGLYTGVYLEFRFGSASVAPFFMTQATKGRAEWTYHDGSEEKISYHFTTQTVGLEFRLMEPGISILAMTQFVQEEDEEDAEVYSVMAGVAF